MIARLRDRVWQPLAVTLLAATPLIVLFAPRAMAWWPALLGLIALPLLDRTKAPSWVSASVPLWAGTLSLVSVLWAAFPHDAFELALRRLPMLYGLSLGIIGLTWLHADVWRKALTYASYVFVACVGLAFLEYSFDYPYNHMLFVQTGETNLKLETAAIMNRAWSALLLLAVPCVWVLWHNGRAKTGLVVAMVMFAALAVSEASATFLAALAGVMIYPLAMWTPRFAKHALLGGTALLLCAMPFVAPWLFEHRPVDWAYIDSPSTGGRLEIWNFVSNAIQLRPVTGYGYEATRFYPFSTDAIYFKQSTVLHPHNMPLQVWMEFGMIGVALALAGLYALGRRIRSPLCLMLATFTLVMAFLSFGMWQGTWLGAAVLAALYWSAAATLFGNKTQ